MRHFGFGAELAMLASKNVAGAQPVTMTDIQRSAYLPLISASMQTAAMRSDMTVSVAASRPILTAGGFVTATPTTRTPTTVSRYSSKDPAARDVMGSLLSGKIDAPQPVDAGEPALLGCPQGYIPHPTVPAQCVPKPSGQSYTPPAGNGCLPGMMPHPQDPTLCMPIPPQEKQGGAGGSLPLIAAAAAAALLLMR